MDDCPICHAPCSIRTFTSWTDRDMYVCDDCLVRWPRNRPNEMEPHTDSVYAGAGHAAHTSSDAG